jgi:hypothetical protein
LRGFCNVKKRSGEKNKTKGRKINKVRAAFFTDDSLI